MRLPETRRLFEGEFTYPVEGENVIESIGDVEIEAPRGESESIANILEVTDVNEYNTVDELYNEILSCVGESYVGRKYYDDRSSNQPRENEHLSF